MTQTERINDRLVEGDVSDELLYLPSVDAHLLVTANDGVVTIAGEVDSLHERRTAHEAAERVWGVRSVVDAMTVGPADRDWDDEGDESAERTARQLLDWCVAVPAGTVAVAVEDHVVTLSGTVTWAFQSHAAARAVGDMRGISAVRNDITLAESPSVSVMQDAVEAAIRRSAPLDPHAISVRVDAHAVTLDGAVRSASERRQAEGIAWAAAGVASVDNQLRLTSVNDEQAFLD